MEVGKIEAADGTLEHLEFLSTGDADFKAVIKTWIQANYPTITWQQFFERLEEYRGSSKCRINML